MSIDQKYLRFVTSTAESTCNSSTAGLCVTFLPKFPVSEPGVDFSRRDEVTGFTAAVCAHSAQPESCTVSASFETCCLVSC